MIFCNRMFPLEGEIVLMLLILHLAAIHVVEIVARGRPSSPRSAPGRNTRCGPSTTPRSTSKSPTPSSRTNPNCAAANTPPSKKSRRKRTTSSPPPTPPAPPTAPPPLLGEGRGGAAVQPVVAVEGAHGGVAGLFGQVLLECFGIGKLQGDYVGDALAVDKLGERHARLFVD